MKLSKSEAHAEVLRQWRARPSKARADYKMAIDFAAELAPKLDFDTLGDRRKVVEGWLVSEVDGFATPAALYRRQSCAYGFELV